MTAGSRTHPDHNLSTAPYIRTQIACAGTWAGSERAASLLELPGMLAWVHSTPAGSSKVGGDVHYVSVCPGCVVSRVALADVSGHGKAVSTLAGELRQLMQRYLPELEHDGLMRDLNQAVQGGLDGVHYATMVAVGWHDERRSLLLANAGHPIPCVFKAKRKEWTWLEINPEPRRPWPVGVPLGLFACADYDKTAVKLQAGDLVLLYSDGVTESTNPAGDELGPDGLMNLVRQIDCVSAEDLGVQLTSALRGFRGGAEADDDETIIVLERVSTDSDQPLCKRTRRRVL
jgi:sigma-B regulation protein RsbU (phosphoserine phosphatase)